MRLLSALLFLVLSLTPLTPAQAASQSEKTFLKKIERYFDALKFMKADFVQINDDGSLSKGIFRLLRPGRFRLDYIDPDNLLVLSDGKKIINIDLDEKEASYVDLNSTPAEIILKPKVRFGTDVIVTSILPGQYETSLTMVRANDPEVGSLTLIFREHPTLQLVKWIVHDPQGAVTQVQLSKIDTKTPVDAGIFDHRRIRK